LLAIICHHHIVQFHLMPSHVAFFIHVVAMSIMGMTLSPFQTIAPSLLLPFLFLPSFAKCYFSFSITVHLLPVNPAPCPKPLCQISPYLKLFWSGSKMTQV
ncbi:hypothetical protein, partial [Lactiplantibacillus plantarum]|uniref:hypothetical protein n=1 Tax=Lactiplantibacillus plantarum TaxID=1590 RepID=UPI001C9E2C75